jgi:hypothetical protein
MEIFYPALLSRQKAMLFTGFGRKRLESLAKKGQVRTFTTNGGHKRYFRNDLTKFLNEILQK